MKKTFLSYGPLETKTLATEIKEYLQNGDVILLKGEIGAGKSHFARSLIQSAMDKLEEVPSPTFTLVQTYDTKIGSIWHADLYRLSDQSEIFELGLIDSMNAMELIIDIESNFNISLTHEDFEDDRFFSISGLSQIINEKQQ